MKLLGVEFAPLSIPLERRLQTLGVLHYTSCFLFLGFGMLFLFLFLVFTQYFFIPAAYLLWYLYDRRISERGGRRSEVARRWSLLRFAANYFPVRLVKTEELHPSRNYILACHPHGVMCQSHFINFASDGTGFSTLFPAIRPYLCVLSGQFMFPVFRDYLMLFGGIEVSKPSIEWVLTREGTGNALAIMVGGATEALNARPDNFRLKLQSRKGFCRMALKHGAAVVPVYAFGENDIFDQVPNPPGSKVRRLQTFLTKTLGFSPALFHGRGIFNYTFGILPHRRPITTVVGAPLEVDQQVDPTAEQVDQLHKRYCDALVDLFETHKLKYGVLESHHLELQ